MTRADQLAGTAGDQVAITLHDPIEDFEDFVERIRPHKLPARRSWSGPGAGTLREVTRHVA
ncbi:hypothetical protein GCM10023194_53880 [Planotetraspora phitsanulokensis]|uniref:Uncharacterized protein n=1 Tax=Planotetraspora phitsanulokensis TaxID=575192 RepID=A0A8J3U442_9ACTN|nr:hypothetical protein [Planotetraspora phitsanulokensis]GII36642.1 hypothetical protein Pph01_16450 [Planotetraspora phitsanulokensis]